MEIEKEMNFDAIIYHLWALPKWKKQVETVHLIVNSLPSHLVMPLLEKVSREMETVESDRKDKFYYLISLLVDRLEVNLDNLELILSYAGDSLVSYYWRLLLKKINLEDEKIQDFLVGYIAYCPPYLLSLFDGVALEKERVSKVMKRENLGYSNRGYLYRRLHRG